MVKGDISSEEEADELIKMFEEPHNQIINNLETFKTTPGIQNKEEG